MHYKVTDPKNQVIRILLGDNVKVGDEIRGSWIESLVFLDESRNSFIVKFRDARGCDDRGYPKNPEYCEIRTYEIHKKSFAILWVDIPILEIVP